MNERNIYRNSELGFSIEKPEDWTFIPERWAVHLLIHRADPPSESDDELVRYAQGPLVYFHYDHRLSDRALPTVQVMHRTMNGADSIDRGVFLRMQLIQLEMVFRDFRLLEATPDGLISKRPANIIKSIFTVYNLEGYELECLSRSYLIFAGDFMLSVEMSGPVEGDFSCEDEFKDVLASIRID